MPKPLRLPSILRVWWLFVLLGTNCANAFGQGSALNQSTQALYRGDYAEASELAKAHLRKFPNDVPVRVVLARVEFAQAEFLQAFEDLQMALAHDPKNVDALYYLALTARELSQRESQRLFSMAPDSALVHRLLGETALTGEKNNEAEEEFKKALQADPLSFEVLTEMAELKQSQMKFDEAIPYYTQAEQVHPNNYEIAYGLGVCFTHIQEYPRAVEWLKKAVALAPDSATGRVALGRALFQNGQFVAAVQELKTSLRLEPSLSEAYYLLGRAYAKLGRSEDAKAAFQKFEELDRAALQGTKGKPVGAPAPKG